MRPLGRPRRRWEGNIIMDLEVVGMNTRNWVYSAGLLVSPYECGIEPKVTELVSVNVINFNYK